MRCCYTHTQPLGVATAGIDSASLFVCGRYQVLRAKIWSLQSASVSLHLRVAEGAIVASLPQSAPASVHTPTTYTPTSHTHKNGPQDTRSHRSSTPTHTLAANDSPMFLMERSKPHPGGRIGSIHTPESAPRHTHTHQDKTRQYIHAAGILLKSI